MTQRLCAPGLCALEETGKYGAGADHRARQPDGIAHRLSKWHVQFSWQGTCEVGSINCSGTTRASATATRTTAEVLLQLC